MIRVSERIDVVLEDIDKLFENGINWIIGECQKYFVLLCIIIKDIMESSMIVYID